MAKVGNSAPREKNPTFVTQPLNLHLTFKYKTMEPKRIFRSKNDRVLGGVCGGLGYYFNIDPVLIRVLWAVSFFAAGMGLLGYFIAWIIIPEEPGT